MLLKKFSFYLQNNIFTNQQKHMQPNHLETLNIDENQAILIEF